jgi:hypothetical protein
MYSLQTYASTFHARNHQLQLSEQAGIATKNHLHDISKEVFMEVMRINALS